MKQEKPESMRVHALVNGYGAPKLPREDRGYHHYLGAVLDFVDLELDAGMDVTLVLAGGYTNREDLSEAGAMLVWLEANCLDPRVRVEMVVHTQTCRENVEATHALLGDVPIHVFCEYSRWPATRMYVMRHFDSYAIYPIAFDEASMTFWHRAKQFLRVPIEFVASFVPPLDRWFFKKRMLRMMRARKLANEAN